MFFVITNSDGDTTVRPCNKEQVQQYLHEEGNEDLQFVSIDQLRKNKDTNYWGERGVLIIRGDVVVPTAKEKVTEWSLED